MVSFDKEFRDVSDHINLHRNGIYYVANATDIAKSKKARETEEANRQSEHALLVRVVSVSLYLSPSSS